MISARKTLERYGTQAVLFTPNGVPVYDPDTGETITLYVETNILFYADPLESNDQDFGLSHFSKAEIWFMPINTNSVPTPGVDSTSYIQTQNESMDIQAINKVIVKNEIVCYTAMVAS